MQQLPALSDSPSFNNDEYYEVERIIGHVANGMDMWFWVRWKGYGPEHDTWEHESSFMNPHCVQSYLATIEQDGGNGNHKNTLLSPKTSELIVVVDHVEAEHKTQQNVSDSNNNGLLNNLSENNKYCPTYKRYKNEFQKNEWKVADILNDRTTFLGTKELLVRWENIEDPSMSFHSWELQSSLDCHGAIMKFYA